MLVYEYLDNDLLSLVRKQIPLRARQKILKDALQGLADMHDCDIVHLGGTGTSAVYMNGLESLTLLRCQN